jgi:cytochrome c551/c552
MKTKISILSTVILLSISVTSSYSQDGATLYKNTCGACHTVGKGKLVGPDLIDVNTKHSQEWLLSWVKSSQTMVKKGDKEAVAVFNENFMIPMPDQAIPEGDIKAILNFIVETSALAKTPKVDPPPVQSGTSVTSASAAEQSKAASTGISATVNPLFWIFMGLVVLLLLVIYVLSQVVVALGKSQPKS